MKQKIKEWFDREFKLPNKIALGMILIPYAIVGILFTIQIVKDETKEVLEFVFSPKSFSIKASSQDAGDSGVGSDERDDSVQYAEVTAYTSRVQETDGSPYITADGTNLKEIYECTIASNDYDFGTRIAIDTLGICEVRDRMNSRYTGQNKMDVYMGNDVTRAKEFGRRELAFKVLK